MSKTVEEAATAWWLAAYQGDTDLSVHDEQLAISAFTAGAAHGRVEEREAIKPNLDGLLLDLYPLTIANAPMEAGEQRQFAEDMAAHIGRIRQRGEK